MGTVVIELNDPAVTVRTPDRLLLESPACALPGTDGIEVGSAALAKARLQPRAVNSRFWDELSLEPLPRHNGAIRSHADFACAHLAHIWEHTRENVDGALFVVPGSFTRQQLGLLLGIAQECGVPVAGMIDAAVAAAGQPAPGRSLLHLDILLHRMVLTRLTQGARLSRAGVETSPRVSQTALRDAWIKAIAEAFVHATRFDPLHRAETEQRLYDGLDVWLDEAEREGTSTVELATADGKTLRLALKRDRLRAISAEPYAAVAELIASTSRAGEPLTLLLSHRCARLPGLVERLSAFPEWDVIALAADAAARGAFSHEAHIRSSSDDEVAFVTHVPWRLEAERVHAPRAPAPLEGAVPTHVLYQGRAHSITETPLQIGSEPPADARRLIVAGQLRGVSRRHCSLVREGDDVTVSDHSSYGTFLNGEKIDGHANLQVGDRLRVGTPGHELQAIVVVPEDGA